MAHLIMVYATILVQNTSLSTNRWRNQEQDTPYFYQPRAEAPRGQGPNGLILLPLLYTFPPQRPGSFSANLHVGTPVLKIAQGDSKFGTRSSVMPFDTSFLNPLYIAQNKVQIFDKYGICHLHHFSDLH